MPRQWTDNDKFRLLLAIIDTVGGDSKNPDWSVVAGKMGEGFTVEAVRQKFQNIKRTAKDELADGGTPAVGTPRGRKRAAKTDASSGGDYGAKTPKGKKRGAKVKSEPTVSDAMSDWEETASPKKKQKKTDTTTETEAETEKKGFTSMFPNLPKVNPEEETPMEQAGEESVDQEEA